MVQMSIFFPVQSGLSEIGKKLQITIINLKKRPIFAILGHFWPVFGLLWPRYKFLKVLMSIFFLILNGMSEIGKKILNNNNQFEENTDFGHFKLFLASFW